MNDQSVLVELNQIENNPYQQRQDEDTDAIAEIAVSIFRNGLLQIPSARAVNGHYQLVFGHTRKAAYEMLATKGVPGAKRQRLGTMSLTPAPDSRLTPVAFCLCPAKRTR